MVAKGALSCAFTYLAGTTWETVDISPLAPPLALVDVAPEYGGAKDISQL